MVPATDPEHADPDPHIVLGLVGWNPMRRCEQRLTSSTLTKRLRLSR
ncbi:MAG: hypothetical protein QOH07_2690 [Mycobacterium sp.]|jgi:hypothetical protein|nr:hypothetical protein [Mycobacterium sp.]